MTTRREQDTFRFATGVMIVAAILLALLIVIR
jgi:hypothetical protein